MNIFKNASKSNKKAKSRKSTKKSTVLSGGSGLTRLSKFSNKKALILIAVVVVMGLSAVIYSFAANRSVATVIQAENMTWTSGSKLKINKQSKVEAQALYWNAEGTSTVVLPVNATHFSIYARSNWCDGNPVLLASIDGKEVFKQEISKKHWNRYSVQLQDKDAVKGKHILKISYANDYAVQKKCDRNVYINKVVFNGVQKVDSPIVTPKPTPTQPTPKPAPAPPQTQVTPHHQAPNKLIMIGWRAEQEAEYAKLANKNVSLAYRTCIDYSKNSPAIKRWEANKQNYYFTIAASDRSVLGSIYSSRSDSEEVIKRSNNVGFYMHEVAAYEAAVHTNWNWDAAASRLDWGFLDSMVMQAKAQNKKVVWSEPAQGWQALNNGQYDGYFQKWGNTLVPMFATNFVTDSFNHMPAARTGALQTAQKHGLSLGISTQSWYFIEQPRRYPSGPNTQESYQLNKYGQEVGTTYYQIEGNYPDMAWNSAYMQGIYKFTQELGM